MRHLWQTRTVWVLSMMLALGTLGCAQVSDRDLRREIEILKKNQEEIRKELEALKAAVQGQQPRRVNVRDVEFELANSPILGKKDAPFILVEFTDYQ